MEERIALQAEDLRAYLDYLRDLGVYELYRRGPEGDRSLAELFGYELLVTPDASREGRAAPLTPSQTGASRAGSAPRSPTAAQPAPARRPGNPAEEIVPLRAVPLAARKTLPAIEAAAETPTEAESSIPRPISFNDLAPLPEVRVAAGDAAAALAAIQKRIGDCTRCPLAYAGRHTIVFGDGDPNASLMFVGEGPGADEDASGLPFVGKAGHLLNNMIAAMGVAREQVYIANIVKCRPPGNRAPEPVEANTCSQFLLEQMDVVQPKVVVALGATAATYLLGVKQSLASLRGRWHPCRGAKLVVTYHPAFLLRDPRQKGEAWKDLQMVMAELGLTPPTKGQVG